MVFWQRSFSKFLLTLQGNGAGGKPKCACAKPKKVVPRLGTAGGQRRGIGDCEAWRREVNGDGPLLRKAAPVDVQPEARKTKFSLCSGTRGTKVSR